MLCGFRQDVTRYLGAADLFVLPTLSYESLPMVIIEAMAMRVPVIASDVGGIRELIEDRVTGRVLPPGDVSALTEAIKQIVEQPQLAKKWANEAFQRYSGNHTAEAMAQSYHSLLTDNGERQT